MTKSKKKPRISKVPSSNVTNTDISNKDKHLMISYIYLDLKNKKYSMDLLGSNREIISFYNDFNKKLKEYSGFEDFRKKITTDKTYSKRNHIHPIDWIDNQIREASFTSLNSHQMEQISEDCWQLGINNQGFRIHGFFIENVFYIVWLDPCHNLYDRK